MIVQVVRGDRPDGQRTHLDWPRGEELPRVGDELLLAQPAPVRGEVRVIGRRWEVYWGAATTTGMALVLVLVVEEDEPAEPATWPVPAVCAVALVLPDAAVPEGVGGGLGRLHCERPAGHGGQHRWGSAAPGGPVTW